MTLGEKQRLFGKLLGTLLTHIYGEGYEVTVDWCYRPPEVAAYYASLGIGIRNSLHTLKLAVDLNLFKDGVWLSDTKDHEPIGVFWEGLHPLCRWGGRFGDGNHYALFHEGKS